MKDVLVDPFNFLDVHFQMLIKEKAEALQEEVDDLLMLPSDLPSL